MLSEVVRRRPSVLSRKTCSTKEGCLLALATRAEDRGADAHMGGAKADCLLEIGAHAHAEDTEPGAPSDFAQQREMQRRLLVERWDAHQALDRQVEPVAAFDDEVVGRNRKNS